MLRVFNHYVSTRKLALFFAETFAMSVACVGGVLITANALSTSGSPIPWSTLLPWMGLLTFGVVSTMQGTMYHNDLYDLRVAGEDRKTGSRFLKAAGLTAAQLAIGMVFLPVKMPVGSLFGGAVFALVAALVVRTSMRAVLGEPSRVLVLGHGLKALAVTKAIQEGGEDGFEIITHPGRGEEPLQALAGRVRAEYVVVALDEPRGAMSSDELVRCRFEGIKVYEAAAFCERVLRRIPVAHLRPSLLAFSDEMTVSKSRRIAKRTFDLIVSTLLAILAAPLMGIVAALIKLDSPGPVFYRQERVGLGGKNYALWKFRSMRVDAEKDGAVWARTNDDRVTRVGRVIRKARIDEIPQVFNVLLGQMSFVGPRPERPVFVDQLKQQVPFYALREGVKPGLTGWAQIRYPYGASVEDAKNKLEYDLYYVKNGSLFLDVAIIFHTVRHVLQARGAR